MIDENDSLDDDSFKDETQDKYAEVVEKLCAPNSKVKTLLQAIPADIKPRLLAMPTIDLLTLQEKLQQLTDADVSVTDLPGEWWSTLLEGRSLQEDVKTPLRDNVNDPNRLWDNKLEVINASGTLVTLAPTKRNPSSNKLTEATVDMLFAEEQASGQTIAIDLYHTGITVTFQPPLARAYLALQAKIDNAVYEYFKNTFALRYSSALYVRTREYVDFALSHVVSTSLKTTGSIKSQLLSIIHPFDIDHLLAGFAQTFNPKGVPVKLACTNDIGQCFHVEEGILHIKDMLGVDTLSLTNEQKLHMSKRSSKSHTHEDVRKYQDAFNRHTTIKLSNQYEVGINGYLTLEDYFSASDVYEQQCTAFVAELGPESNVDREDIINKFIASSELMTYSHWVNFIKLTRSDGGVISINNPRTLIYRALSRMSTDPKTVDGFISALNSYFNKHKMSHVGIEGYDCPVCSAKQGNHVSEQLTDFVTINPIRFFMELVQSKINEIDTTTYQ